MRKKCNEIDQKAFGLGQDVVRGCQSSLNSSDRPGRPPPSLDAAQVEFLAAQISTPKGIPLPRSAVGPTATFRPLYLSECTFNHMLDLLCK